MAARDPIIAVLTALGLVGEVLFYEGANRPFAVPLALAAAIRSTGGGPTRCRPSSPPGSPSRRSSRRHRVRQRLVDVRAQLLHHDLLARRAHPRPRGLGLRRARRHRDRSLRVQRQRRPAWATSRSGSVLRRRTVGDGLALRLRGDLAATNAQLKLEQEEATRRAVAEERATIARELHDVVAHAISVTVLQSRGARRMLGTRRGAGTPRARRHRAHQHPGARRHAPAAGDPAGHRGRRRDRTAAVAGTARRPGRRRPRLRAGRRGRGGRRGPRRAAGRRPVGVPDHPGVAHERAQARRGRAGDGAAGVRRGRAPALGPRRRRRRHAA